MTSPELIRVGPESSLQCDICFNDFDHDLNKPLVLQPCCHTICSDCVKRLLNRTCPTCRSLFTNKAPNFAILKMLECKDVQQRNAPSTSSINVQSCNSLEILYQNRNI